MGKEEMEIGFFILAMIVAGVFCVWFGFAVMDWFSGGSLSCDNVFSDDAKSLSEIITCQMKFLSGLKL